MGDRGDVRGWVFLEPDAVPERWRDRAQPVMLIPLLPDEAEGLLADLPVRPGLDRRDEEIVSLLAEGRSAREIADRLALSLRTVERRLAELRRRFTARSTAELCARLARKGFE